MMPSLGEAAGNNIFQYFLVRLPLPVSKQGFQRSVLLVWSLGILAIQCHFLCLFLKTSSSQDWSLQLCHPPLIQRISATKNTASVQVWFSTKWTLHLKVAWMVATCQAGMDTHLGWNREWHWNVKSCVIFTVHIMSNFFPMFLDKNCFGYVSFNSSPVYIPTQVCQWLLDKRESKGQNWSFVLHLERFTVVNLSFEQILCHLLWGWETGLDNARGGWVGRWGDAEGLNLGERVKTPNPKWKDNV